MARMLKPHARIVVLLALAAAMALTLLALMAFGGRGPAAAHAAVRHAKQAATTTDRDNVQVGDQTSPDPVGAAARKAAAHDPAGGSQAGGADPAGNNDPAGGSQAGGADPASSNDPAGGSQAGGPDPAGSSGESTVDSEQGQPGEPANGHADPAGSAGSNCTGNCVQ